MTEYISKSALVAEIKRLLAFYLNEIEDNKEDPWAMDIAKRDILQEILSFLNTLEVKEVDLCKEEERIWKDFNMGECHLSKNDLEKISKHFFELGLKAQKAL